MQSFIQAMHSYKYNYAEKGIFRFPLCSFGFTEQVGGNAEVFRTLGEKWRGLDESDKDSYRRKAAKSTSLTGVSSLSQDERAKRIIKNMMKEVA